MMHLYHDDCFNVFPTLEDKSIDLVLCDMPYGTTACKWDTVLDLAAMWEHLKRISKLKAAIVLTSSQPFTSVLVMSNISSFKYEIVWDKVNRSTGFGNVSFMPLKRHENVLVFVSEGKPTYNKQMTIGEPYTAKRSGKKAEVYANGGLRPKDGVNLGERNPVSILPIKADNKKEIGKHPTQKPVALMEYLIKTYSNEGDVVLDFCMGSGTTGVAAKNLNRNFIGVEKEEKYYQIAKERIGE